MKNPESSDNKDNIIVVINKIITDLLQLIPAMVFISCILLWIYLSQIHRLDLFIPSISDVSSIIPIALSFFHYLAFQIAPITPLLLILAITKGYMKDERKLYIKVPLIITISLLLFVISIYLIAIITSSKYYTLTLLVISLTLTILTTLCILGFNLTHLFRKLVIISAISLSLLLIFKSNSFGRLITLLSINENEDVKTFLYVVLITFFCILCSCIPILYAIYAILTSRHSKLSMIISVFFTILPILIFKSLSIYSVHMAMIKIGIADWCEDTYLISGQKYTKEMFPAQHWKTQSIPSSAHFFIHAVTPFRLGGNVLLCPNYLVSNYDPFISMSFNISKNIIKEKNRLITQQFQSCYIFNKSDIEKSNTTFTNILSYSDLESVKTCH